MKKEENGPGTYNWEKLKVKVFINSVKLAKGSPGMIKRIEKDQDGFVQTSGTEKLFEDCIEPLEELFPNYKIFKISTNNFIFCTEEKTGKALLPLIKKKKKLLSELEMIDQNLLICREAVKNKNK